MSHICWRFLMVTYVLDTSKINDLFRIIQNLQTNLTQRALGTWPGLPGQNCRLLLRFEPCLKPRPGPRTSLPLFGFARRQTQHRPQQLCQTRTRTDWRRERPVRRLRMKRMHMAEMFVSLYKINSWTIHAIFTQSTEFQYIKKYSRLHLLSKSTSSAPEKRIFPPAGRRYG